MKKGVVVQIVKNAKLGDYLGLAKIAVHTEKDLVVLRNPDYPGGFKGYFLSFKNDKPESIFPILMDSAGIELGQELEIECQVFFIPSGFYEQVPNGGD